MLDKITDYIDPKGSDKNEIQNILDNSNFVEICKEILGLYNTECRDTTLGNLVKGRTIHIADLLIMKSVFVLPLFKTLDSLGVDVLENRHGRFHIVLNDGKVAKQIKKKINEGFREIDNRIKFKKYKFRIASNN